MHLATVFHLPINTLVCINVATCFMGEQSYLKVRGQTDLWIDYIIDQLNENMSSISYTKHGE